MLHLDRALPYENIYFGAKMHYVMYYIMFTHKKVIYMMSKVEL